MYKNLKNERAITLIALIITIIILVILAAVSIRAVYNMGIVNHAINGTAEYGRAAKNENKLMQDTGNFIEDTISKIKNGQGGKAYVIGDSITLNDEVFYVIEDSPASQSTVKLFAAKVVNPVTNKQVDTRNGEPNTTLYIPFGSPNKSYENSTIKGLVETYVATLGIDVVNSRLLSYNDLVNMGYPYSNLYDNDWIEAPSFLKHDIMVYWLIEPWDGDENWIWVICGYDDIHLGTGEVFDAETNINGLRPVIEVLKSNLPD